MPKPPSDTGQKWLAAGALIAVAVGVSFASSALKSHLASTLPKQEPTSYPTAITTPTPPPPVAKTPDEEVEEDAPPANDRRTLPAGTPKSSAATTPAWARFDSSRAGDKPVMRYAPFHSRASQLLATASTPTEDVARAVVVCRGSTNDDKSDLVLRVTIGSMPELASDAKRQLGQTYVTAPLVDVKKGQNVDAALFVRKPGGLTPLVEMHAKIGDDDLQKDTDDGTVECGFLTGEALLDRIAQEAGRVDASIAKVAALRVDTKKEFDIDPNNEEAKARRSIGDLAALTGWADPRIKPRLNAFDAALAKNDVDDRRAFEELYRDATKETIIGSVTLTLDRVACTTDKCELSVFVQNGGQTPFTWQQSDLALNYLLAGKDRIDQETEDEHVEVMIIGPGQQRKVTLNAQPGMTTAKSLAQICIGPGEKASCGVIRVH